MNNVEKKRSLNKDAAYTTLQQNYNDLMSEHSRALIAVDQLRVAKYLARPRSHHNKVCTRILHWVCLNSNR